MDSDVMNEIARLRSQILALENRMEFLYKRLNILYVDGNSGIDPRLMDAIRKGNKIEAIKIYREITKCGLAEAKTAVEEMWAKY